MRDPNFLQTLWFVLIGVLWVGYFVLEGFDFGVGMLLRALGRDDTDKRMIIHTIGPVWDGNEVWLLTAGGATFAAFPGWYASLFSGFYLALFLILAALIIRGVSFEFWGKEDSPRWRATWEWTAVIGSLLAALLWGVGWADIVHGVPMNASHDVTASLWDLLHPYALLGGLVTLSLFLAHGAIFLTLRTRGEMVARARRVALRASLATAVADGRLPDLDRVRPGRRRRQGRGPGDRRRRVRSRGRRSRLVRRHRDGRAFALSAGAIALLFASLFVGLFPDALPSTTAHAYDLTLVGRLRQSLHPDRDDRRRRDLRADRARLPGLDLLGLPPPSRPRRLRGRRRRRSPCSRASTARTQPPAKNRRRLGQPGPRAARRLSMAAPVDRRLLRESRVARTHLLIAARTRCGLRRR